MSAPPRPSCTPDRPCGLCAGCTDDTLQRAAAEARVDLKVVTVPAWLTEAPHTAALVRCHEDLIDAVQRANRLRVERDMCPRWRRRRYRLEIAYEVACECADIIREGLGADPDAPGLRAIHDAVLGESA